jgi:hypothetical protein
LLFIPSSQLVFIDECGIGKQDVCVHGYAPRGQKIPGFCRGRERGKTNVVAGLCAGEVLGFYSSPETMNIVGYLNNWTRIFGVRRLAAALVVANSRRAREQFRRK